LGGREEEVGGGAGRGRGATLLEAWQEVRYCGALVGSSKGTRRALGEH